MARIGFQFPAARGRARDAVRFLIAPSHVCLDRPESTVAQLDPACRPNEAQETLPAQDE